MCKFLSAPETAFGLLHLCVCLYVFWQNVISVTETSAITHLIHQSLLSGSQPYLHSPHCKSCSATVKTLSVPHEEICKYILYFFLDLGWWNMELFKDHCLISSLGTHSFSKCKFQLFYSPQKLTTSNCWFGFAQETEKECIQWNTEFRRHSRSTAPTSWSAR